MLFGNAGVIAASGGGGLPPYQSLSFNGINQYLSMSAANFGNPNRGVFSLICAFNKDVNANMRLISSYDSGTGARELELFVHSTGYLRFYAQTANERSEFRTAAATVVSGTWYAVKVDFDWTQGVSTGRIKMSVNGSPVSASRYTAPTAAMQDDDAQYNIGAGLSNGSPTDYYNGLIYQPALISGSNPADSAVFDGTSGKLKDIAALTGAHSHIPATDDPVTDSILATDWTNNGTVTTSSTVP